jgi:hypothetical protein
MLRLMPIIYATRKLTLIGCVLIESAKILFYITESFAALGFITFIFFFFQQVFTVVFCIVTFKIEKTCADEISENYRLNNEKRLIDDLFKNYQVKFGRPVNNMTEQVIVYFGLYLVQLIDLVSPFIDCLSSLIICRFTKSLHFRLNKKDERNQVLVTNVKSVYVSLKSFK